MFTFTLAKVTFIHFHPPQKFRAAIGRKHRHVHADQSVLFRTGASWHARTSILHLLSLANTIRVLPRACYTVCNIVYSMFYNPHSELSCSGMSPLMHSTTTSSKALVVFGSAAAALRICPVGTAGIEAAGLVACWVLISCAP